MRSEPQERPAERQGRKEPCLVRTVTESMKREPALEAVKVDRPRRSISVATIGRANQEKLENYLQAQIQMLETEDPEQRCGLWEGESDCSHCSRPLAEEQEGRVTIEQHPGCTTIARVTCPTAPRFWRWRNIAWPRILPRTVPLPDEEDHEHEWKRQMLASALCGLFALAGHFFGAHHWDEILFGVAYLAGAWFTVHEVWERLQQRVLDVHFLMLAVAVGSAAIGAYTEGATLLFLFSFSGALEHYALGRTHREIRSLFKSAPKVATILDDQGQEQEVPVEQLRPGLRLMVKPGQQFPVDAEVVKGNTASDESNLTGEATPVSKGVGDPVFAGTINVWGSVEAVVLRPAHQSALQKMIHLIREAQQRKAPAQRFTDRFGTPYTYGLLGLTLAMFFVWWLGFGLSPFLGSAGQPSAFYRAMTLLVVASPCALVLSIPSAVLAAIAWAARRGILFRGGAAVEKLAEVTVVAMDKTGTLTTGELKVETVESFPPGREEEVARLAYSLERLSNHPLARAVTRHGKQQQLQPVKWDEFTSVTGQGLEGRLGRQKVLLGRREWLADGPHAGTIARVAPTEAGFSETWLAHDDLVGRLVLRDDIRPESRQVVARLREAGLRTLVLTGDRQPTADYLQAHLTPDAVRAELRPEEKVAVIQSLIEQGDRPVMVGDGVNDAPSLAAAYVGVAMGARGSDAALEQAEVVLMHDRLENVLTAHQLSLRARRIIRQNLVVSLGTVLILVLAALSGSIPLTVGVLGHEGSTVVVVINSLRLLLTRSPAFAKSSAGA